MKKKLLSLVLAGAMVASTSVSAFAATGQNVTVIKNSETETGQAEVTITGDIEDNKGTTKPGTLNVTVPTAANFSVNQNGEFIGTEINVQNSGTQNIDVFAYEFIDTTKNSGITVVKEADLPNQARSKVALRLEGSDGTAYFTSAPENRGVYSNLGCSDAGGTDGVKIATINKGGSYELRLRGTIDSTQTELQTPENDTFTLRLKIKKASQNG